jgi:hypothetical protein
LLKPIEHLSEFVDVVGELGTLKTWWLLNIDKLLNGAIEEYTLNTHLV